MNPGQNPDATAPHPGLEHGGPSAGVQVGGCAGDKVCRRENHIFPARRHEACLDPTFTENKILFSRLFGRFSRLRRSFLMLFTQLPGLSVLLYKPNLSQTLLHKHADVYLPTSCLLSQLAHARTLPQSPPPQRPLCALRDVPADRWWCP